MTAGRAPVPRKATTGLAEKDHTEPPFSLDFKAWIKEQQQEIEDLKRAARGFSPNNSTSQGHDLSTRRSQGGGLVNGSIDGDGADSSTKLAVDGSGRSAAPPSMLSMPLPARPQHNTNRVDTRDGGHEERLTYDGANDRSGGHGSAATLSTPSCNRMISGVVPKVSAYNASPDVRSIQGSSSSSRAAWRDGTRSGGAYERDATGKASHRFRHEELPRAWHSPDDAESAPSPKNGHDGLSSDARGAGQKGDAVTEGTPRRRGARAGRQTCVVEGVGDSTKMRGATAVASVAWQGMSEEAEASWWAVDESDVALSYAERKQSYREAARDCGAHAAIRAEPSKAISTGSSISAAVCSLWEGSKGADSAYVGRYRQVSGGTGVERRGDKLLVAHDNRALERSHLDASGVGGGAFFHDRGGTREAMKASSMEAARLESRGSSSKDRARATVPLDANRLETAGTEPLAREGLSQTRTKLASAHSSAKFPADVSGSDDHHLGYSGTKGRLASAAIGGLREELQPSQGVAVGGGIDGSAFTGSWSLGMEGSRQRRSVSSVAEGKTPSLADSFATRREEQSVLARQLERELASTVSALREGRRQRRVETEVFRSKLEEARATVVEREAELERRGVMMKSIMSELEALQARCDRLTASREKRTEEMEKAMGRLIEDNRELEARLRRAEAAVVEAQVERDDARAEMNRISKDLLSAKALATAAERRAEEAEAAMSTVTGSAEVHRKTLEKSEEERECLRREVDGLRKRLEQEGGEGMVASLRTQVDNLERELAAANQRYKALEARLDLSGEKLTGECGEERREYRHGGCINEEGGRRSVERGFDRDEPTQVDAVSCDRRKQELSRVDRLSARKENIDERHGEGHGVNIDADGGRNEDGGNIRFHGDGDRGTTVAGGMVDEYEELNRNRMEPALFPSGRRNRDAVGATSGDSTRPFLLGSAGNRGVGSRPHRSELLRETLEELDRASGEKVRLAGDAYVEGQASTGMVLDHSGGERPDSGSGMLAGCGAGQGAEGKEEEREDMYDAARRGLKILHPKDSVLAHDTEGDQREIQRKFYNRRAAERSGFAAYDYGRGEGPIFRGFDENGVVAPGDFRGAPEGTTTRKGSCNSSSSSYREMLDLQSSSRAGGVVRHRTEEAVVDRPQTPAPTAMRPSAFTPEGFERNRENPLLEETRRDARRGLGIGVRREGSYRGGGEQMVSSRRRQLQVHDSMPQKAQASKGQTSGAIADRFTTSRKAQQILGIPERRRAARVATDSNTIDRARNALAHSRSTTASMKRRSVASSLASRVVPAAGVGIRSRARVVRGTSITPASEGGQRRLRSATLASSAQQQRHPRKTPIVPPRARQRVDGGGDQVFSGSGVFERGRRGGYGGKGRSQRGRDRSMRSARMKASPTNLRTTSVRADERDALARSGSVHKMRPTGSGRTKAPAGTGGVSSVPLASSSFVSGSVRSNTLARESVSLMRKRRERAGMGSGGAFSQIEMSSRVSGRNDLGHRSGGAGFQARRDGGVASGKVAASSSGSRAWRP